MTICQMFLISNVRRVGSRSVHNLSTDKKNAARQIDIHLAATRYIDMYTYILLQQDT